MSRKRTPNPNEVDHGPGHESVSPTNSNMQPVQAQNAPSTTPACDKVLGTTELLESILVGLPFKSLFGVQRVSRRFQAVIAGSIHLQELMFLRAVPETQAVFFVAKDGTTCDCKIADDNGIDPCISVTVCYPVELNPLLKPCPGSGLTITSEKPCPHPANFLPHRQPVQHELGLFETSEGASWGKTFLTNPPVKSVAGDVEDALDDPVDFEMDNPEGVTFNDLRLAIVKASADDVEEYTGPQWKPTHTRSVPWYHVDEHWIRNSFSLVGVACPKA